MLSDDELCRLLGEAVRRERRKAGLTQMQLANYIGVSRPQVANIEIGRSLPSGFTMLRLVRLLDIDIRNLEAT